MVNGRVIVGVMGSVKASIRVRVRVIGRGG